MLLRTKLQSMLPPARSRGRCRDAHVRLNHIFSAASGMIARPAAVELESENDRCNARSKRKMRPTNLLYLPTIVRFVAQQFRSHSRRIEHRRRAVTAQRPGSDRYRSARVSLMRCKKSRVMFSTQHKHVAW